MAAGGYSARDQQKGRSGWAGQLIAQREASDSAMPQRHDVAQLALARLDVSRSTSFNLVHRRAPSKSCQRGMRGDKQHRVSTHERLSLNHLPVDTQVPAGLGTIGESFRLLLVAPASSGLSLSRSRWMSAKWSEADGESIGRGG